ncbi:glycogen debranching N-terminal domain-containing protein [Leptospira interrogans]
MTAVHLKTEQLQYPEPQPENVEKAYISTGPAHPRASRSLKHNDTFAVIDAHGDMNCSAPGADGLFHRDTRYLSYLELAVLGVQPLLLASNISEDATYLRADLTNPDIYRDGQIALLKDHVHFERTVYVRGGMLHQQITITNYNATPVHLVLTIGFDSDFADLFEVRGMRRPRRGTIHHRVCGKQEAEIVCTGLDSVHRRTRITFEPAPAELSPTLATYRLTIAPQERSPIVVDAACTATEELQKRVAYLPGLLEARRDFRRKIQQQAIIETGNPSVNEVLRRSSADLAMLTTETPHGHYPYAGIPWFSTAFGRDGLITAIETLWINPQAASGVLRYLAHHQAVAHDPASDAEPGKILHETRGGEMASLGEVPFGLYYGSIDSTPLFVVLAGLYAERTGDDAMLAELWPNIEAALHWMDTYGDRDGDGFIEYLRGVDTGLANQGWKDSCDSIFHADGQLADGPIALVEVQAYAYEAKRLAARAARRLGKTLRAQQLEASANSLKDKFESAFWCDDIGMYVLALDGHKRQCRVRASNAGHALATGIASRNRADQTSEHLLGAAFFSGWGVRTIADTEARYNPMSYHNGSIWPHDNALIASGLARIGRRDGVERILKALFDAASRMDQRRLPELFCGFRRRRGRAPVLYPMSCSPQAWASGATFYVLQSLLGLEIDGRSSTLRFNAPVVPDWLDYVEIRNLTIGANTKIDVRLTRTQDQRVEVKHTTKQGYVTIEMTGIANNSAD